MGAVGTAPLVFVFHKPSLNVPYLSERCRCLICDMLSNYVVEMIDADVQGTKKLNYS